MNAKRGDLVVVERKTSYVTTSEGYKENVEYEVGIVSSITREGKVKAFRGRYDSPQAISNTFGFLRSFIVPASEIDVEGAARAAWANEWRPGYPGKPFDSLDEVKQTLSPFKVSVAA